MNDKKNYLTPELTALRYHFEKSDKPQNTGPCGGIHHERGLGARGLVRGVQGELSSKVFRCQIIA